MYSPLPALWDSAVRGSQVIETRVDAYRGGVLIASDLPIDPESGQVTADASSEHRRSVDLTIVDPALVPTAADSVLTPHGTELHVSKGFRFPDNTTALIPVGIFRIDKPSTPLGGVISVSAVDRSRLVAEDKFIFAAQSVPGATVVAEIIRLIRQTIPGATVADLTGSTTACRPVAWEQDSSRWAAVTELALAINAEVYADTTGGFVVRPVPQITASAVWTVDIGSNGVLIAGTEEWDRERVYNAVTARSEPADGSNPVQATVYDLSATSPTYWNGPFGHRPRLYSSPLLTTVASCTAAATTILRRSIAPARTVTVSCVPNPALEPGDVVNLVLPGLTETDPPRTEKQMIRSLRLPMGLGAMELDLYTPDPAS